MWVSVLQFWEMRSKYCLAWVSGGTSQKKDTNKWKMNEAYIKPGNKHQKTLTRFIFELVLYQKIHHNIFVVSLAIGLGSWHFALSGGCGGMARFKRQDDSTTVEPHGKWGPFYIFFWMKNRLPATFTLHACMNNRRKEGRQATLNRNRAARGVARVDGICLSVCLCMQKVNHRGTTSQTDRRDWCPCLIVFFESFFFLWILIQRDELVENRCCLLGDANTLLRGKHARWTVRSNGKLLPDVLDELDGFGLLICCRKSVEYHLESRPVSHMVYDTPRFIFCPLNP